jgi:hypothetical protein
VSLEDAHCKLLNWWGTGEVVAKAQIASTNPLEFVHHVFLGPDSYKVWVNEILIHKIPLPRPTSEFFTVDDALNSTIAWPHKYINFD